MPLVEFEPIIPVFERAKTVHTLDRVATVTDVLGSCLTENCSPPRTPSGYINIEK
jgi:hypothetical protein